MVRVLSANIRKPEPADGRHAWELRADLAGRVLAAQGVDLIGFQELRRGQRDDLRRWLPGLRWHGHTRTTGDDHPINAVAWREDAFTAIACGGYALSMTPHVVGSSAWGAASPRNASWVRLRRRIDGAELRLVSSHLDHVAGVARREGARLLGEDAAAYGDLLPQLLCLDANEEPDGPALAELAAHGWRDAWSMAHGATPSGATWHGFRGLPGDGGRIDFVLVRGSITVREVMVVDDHDGDRWPSDHAFVRAEVVW